MIRRSFYFTVAAFFSLLVQHALSVESYVSVKGNDLTGNGTQENPWATIRHAVDQAELTTQTANIYVAQGTYEESIFIGKGSPIKEIHFYGGYDDSAIPWQRDLEQFETVVAPTSTSPPEDYYPFYLQDGVNGVIEGFQVNRTIIIYVLNEPGVIRYVDNFEQGGFTARRIENCTTLDGGANGIEILNCDFTVLRDSATDPWVEGYIVKDSFIKRGGLKIKSSVTIQINGVAEENIITDRGVIAEENTQIKNNLIQDCGTAIEVVGSGVTMQENIIEGCEWGIYGGGEVVNNVIASCGVGTYGVGVARNNIYWHNAIDFWVSAAPTYSWFEYEFPTTGSLWGAEPSLVGWQDFSATQPCWVDVNYAGAVSDGTTSHPFKSISDALFSEAYDYHLAEDSPCRGAGFGVVDMGAYPEGGSYGQRGYQNLKVRVKAGSYPESGITIPYGVVIEAEPGTVLEKGGDTGIVICRGGKARGLTIRGNGEGLGVYFHNFITEGEVEGCIIENNNEGVSQGEIGYGQRGVRLRNCYLQQNKHYGASFLGQVINCLVRGNGWGGVSWTRRVEGSVIHNNKGPGIEGISGDYEVVGNKIYGNEEEGIIVEGNSAQVRDNMVWNNKKTGIAVRYWGSQSSILNNTVWNNQEYGLEGRIHYEYPYPPPSQVQLLNNIIWGNSAGAIGGSWDDPTVEYNCSEGGYPGQGNIALDPLLVNPAAGDLHLRSDSPCIDRASTTTFSPQDIDGESRPLGEKPDIGADEYSATLWRQRLWENSEGWSTESFPAEFTPPEAHATPLGLSLWATNNTDTYGSWRTAGGIFLDSGILYQLQAYVGSNVCEGSQSPDFRLRLNFTSEDEANFMRVSSNNDGAYSPVEEESRLYSFFFEPHISGNAYLSFDLINMDISNYSQGAVCLEEISVGEVSLSGSWEELQRWDFTSDEEGWHHDTIPQHIPTIGWWEAGDLKIRAQDGSNTFGSWTSPLTLNIEPGTLNRVTFAVRREEPDAMLCPALRFRLQDQTFEWSVLKTLVPVSTGSSVPDLTPTNYNVYFYLPSGAATPLLLSMDLYNFWERSHLPYCLDTVTVSHLTP